ncbi:MAG: hypothetical protein ACYS8W_20180 [Planctomycetota bacterium]
MKNSNNRKKKGAALVMAVFVMVLAVGLSISAAMFVHTDVRDIDHHERLNQALYVAEAGLERGINTLVIAMDALTLNNPFGQIDTLNGTQPFLNEPIMSGGDNIGEYTVNFIVHTYTGPGSTTPDPNDDYWRDVEVEAIGIVERGAGKKEAIRTMRVLARLELRSSEVFDYAYFINNWGWWYGSNIVSSGNIRSNGQFDFGGYGPSVNGHPRWDRVVYDPGTGTYDLIGYKDDNGDGIMNGRDGGVYAGWNIVNDGSVKGQPNIYSFEDQIPMPNLSDLAIYEEIAKTKNSSITINGVTVVENVQGDDPGEDQNLYLEGTAANPIIMNGPVVVRGSVIIKGVIKGLGTIYSGHNVYIADDVEYENVPPNDGTPAGTSEGQMEAFLNNPNTQDADGLGLFAREHIIMGDYSSSSWQSSVSSWVNNPLNESEEDAGLDGLPNTAAGQDGIVGTDDDDLLEGDGVWTVEYYTQQHADWGLIPPGMSIGDAIPGTGEDIDGDGAYDPRTSMNEFYIDGNPGGAFDPNLWHNLPGGVTNYNQVATSNIGNIHAAMYTNHTIAGRIASDAPNGNLLILGAVISRNEAIIYSAKNFYMHHDLRLLGGGGAFGFDLPKTWRPVFTSVYQVDIP